MNKERVGDFYMLIRPTLGLNGNRLEDVVGFQVEPDDRGRPKVWVYTWDRQYNEFTYKESYIGNLNDTEIKEGRMKWRRLIEFGFKPMSSISLWKHMGNEGVYVYTVEPEKISSMEKSLEFSKEFFEKVYNGRYVWTDK